MDLNVISEQVLVPALNLVTLALLGMAGAWLKSKLQISKHEKANLVWDEITDIVETTVVSLNQTVVDGLKKNGGWSAEKAKEIKNSAFEKVVAVSGPKLAKLIDENRDYVLDLIERKVRGDKNGRLNP